MQTILYSEHVALKAKMTNFGGFDMPVQYKGILAEHSWCRENASLFDTCHMGELVFKGPEAGAFLNRLLTSHPTSLKDGRCRYGFILNENSTVIDDCIVYKKSEDHYFLVVNAGTKNGDLEHFKTHCPEQGVEILDLTDDLGKIDLQGPKSFEILSDLYGQSFNHLKYFSFEVQGDELISRTGYTGELGVEIYLPANRTVELWRKCLEHPLVEPAGLGARDTLRLECGMALYGHEMNDQTPILCSGGDFFLRDGVDYIGKAAVDSMRDQGAPEKQVALIHEGKSSPRAGEKVLADGKEIGVITSGSLSPSLGQAIAIARISSDVEATAALEVDKGRRRLSVELTELPFYKGGTARKKLTT